MNEQQMMGAPRISWGIFFVLFFFLGIIPGIIYLVVKGNEVNRYEERMAAMASMIPPPTTPAPAPERDGSKA